MRVVRETKFAGISPAARGKVRDIYDVGDKLLIVATDRLSAFDVVLPDPIPGKGEMLTQISNFWFGKTAHIVPNHLLHTPLEEVLPTGTDLALYSKRAVVTKRLRDLTVDGKQVHTVGIPIHWGFTGLTKPGFIANTLTPVVGDGNAQTPEFKSFLVKVEKL